MTRWFKRGLTFLLAMVLAITPVLASGVRAEAHGTTEKEITKKMLKTEVPKDYKINPDTQGSTRKGDYNKFFLEDELQTVSIQADENNLNYLFQNADMKPTVMADSVTIGDKTVQYVGLKTKGNYTLEHTVIDNVKSDRFSFTVNFGKYIKEEKYGEDQEFFGCDKISFNNFFFDHTMMREFFAWKLLSEMGVPTPQYGLAKLYINNKYYGIYFMIEAMDKSIMQQYKNVKGSELSDYLTKPEGTKFVYDAVFDKYLKEDGTFDLSSMLKKDAKGNYKVSGALKNQSPLWEDDKETLQDVAETLPTVLSWEKKLTQLSNGTDFSGKKIDVNSKEYEELLEQVIDVDEFLRYFAAHSFLVQLDNMFVIDRNFGLYVDQSGKSTLIPWDYDLSFGCYYPSTAEATANFNIDQMYKDAEFNFGKKKENDFTYADYPLFHVIYQNSSLMEKYHQYMKECAKIASLGGTTSTGKTYEPGWFQSYIDKMQDTLKKEAAEDLAENVTYLNGQSQPANLKASLPNLGEIIAMRSVGVTLQVDKKDATVCTYGCNLETLGNGAWGESAKEGKLAVVDEKSGIYAIAEYDGGVLNRSPSLTAQSVSDNVKAEIQKATGVSKEDNIRIYSFQNTCEPTGDYELYVPVDTTMGTEGVSLYTYDNGDLNKLDITKTEDNILVAKTDSVRYVIVAKGASAGTSSAILWMAVGAGVLVLIIIGIFVVMRVRKKKKQK